MDDESSKVVMRGYSPNKDVNLPTQVRETDYSIGRSDLYPGFELEMSGGAESSELNTLISNVLTTLNENFGQAELEVPVDEAAQLAKIDLHLKRAVIKNLEGMAGSKDYAKSINGSVSAIYDNNFTSAARLASQLKPQLLLIREVNNSIRRLKAMKDDPDYQRCVFKLGNTLDYLVRDIEPDLQMFMNLTAGQELLHSAQQRGPQRKPLSASQILSGPAGKFLPEGITLTKRSGSGIFGGANKDKDKKKKKGKDGKRATRRWSKSGRRH